MIKMLTILLICFFITKQVYCQIDKSNNRRPPFELKLFVDDSAFYKTSVKESYYVINDSIIQIFPGEKLFIEADIKNDRLINYKSVTEVKNKNKTIVIDFRQMAEDKKHDQMILTIDNPFKKDIHYKAMINLMSNEKWVNTSVVPVMAGLKSIEMWPDIITSIAIYGLELKNE